MADTKKDLRKLKEQFAEKKEEQIRAQTRLDGAKQRRQEATEKIKEEGYDVKTLPTEIKALEDQLSEVLVQIRTKLDGEDEGEVDFDFE